MGKSPHSSRVGGPPTPDIENNQPEPREQDWQILTKSFKNLRSIPPATYNWWTSSVLPCSKKQDVTVAMRADSRHERECQKTCCRPKKTRKTRPIVRKLRQCFRKQLAVVIRDIWIDSWPRFSSIFQLIIDSSVFSRKTGHMLHCLPCYLICVLQQLKSQFNNYCFGKHHYSLYQLKLNPENRIETASKFSIAYLKYYSICLKWLRTA